MTTVDSTTATAEKLRDTKKWLGDGYKGLAVIQAIEKGTQSEHSVPAAIKADGGQILTLCENGELWICPDGTATQAFEEAEIIPAADVAMLYRFFWSMVIAEVCEIAKVLKTGDATAEIDQQIEAATAVDTRSYAERVMAYSSDADPWSRRDCTLFTAPNCQGDILTAPPRVITDPEGFQRVELKGDDGWNDHGVVEEATRFDRYGLVLVATDEAAFLMTAQDFDTPIE